MGRFRAVDDRPRHQGHRQDLAGPAGGPRRTAQDGASQEVRPQEEIPSQGIEYYYEYNEKAADHVVGKGRRGGYSQNTPTLERNRRHPGTHERSSSHTILRTA